MEHTVKWINVKEIPAPKDRRIMVCTHGMAEPWVVQWRDGKRKQGFEHRSLGFIWFQLDFWAELVKCPQ